GLPCSVASALGILVVGLGLAGTVLWAWQAIAWDSRLTGVVRARFALAAATTRGEGYKVSLAYMYEWVCRTRVRSALVAGTYLVFTVWCAWLFLT
ncbi:MAG: hypothetical protein ACJ76A_07715, partial [Actinomycetota bacterium]